MAEYEARPFHTESRTIEGNLTSDPRNISGEGRQVCVILRVACNYRTNSGDEDVFYHGVKLWGTMAENALASLKRGDRIIAAGHVEGRHYTNEDKEDVHEATIVATQLGLSLRFHECEQKRSSGGGGRGDSDDSGSRRRSRREESSEDSGSSRRRRSDDGDGGGSEDSGRRSRRSRVDSTGEDFD